MKNEDWMARLLGRTLFPRAQDIPQPLASAFMRMMMAHANFESEVRALQGVVANSPYYGEQPENLWSAKKRPKLMAKLIEKCLGQIPETEQIRKLLEDACDPTNKRNQLAHGRWCGPSIRARQPFTSEAGYSEKMRINLASTRKRPFRPSPIGLRR
jgi:hypothetical protein